MTRKTRKLVERYVDEQGREWIIKKVSTAARGGYPIVSVPLPILNKLGIKGKDLVAFHLNEKEKTILIRKVKPAFKFEE